MTRMQLTRLCIEQVRQFRQPYELKDFAPGLNLFTGPNEAGKSTLVRAIRAAFFERHRSTSVEDLKPWGDSSASPTIELDFELNGKSYRLTKSFFGRKRCDLTVGSTHFEGAEAEDHLANLFGFAFAGKGASKPEHWGIPGLLWVEQGSGHELDVSHARDHLRTALHGQSAEDTTRDLTATGGDDILKRLQDLRGELLTPTGRSKAAYAQTAEAVEKLEQQLQDLDAQILTYREQVDKLSKLREQQQADDRDKPWERLQTELSQSQDRQRELQQLQAQLSVNQAQLNNLEQSKALLQAQMLAFEEQETQAKTRGQAALETQAELERMDSALLLARHKAQEAQQRTTQARNALTLAQQDSDRQRLNEQLQTITAAAQQQTQALDRAQAEAVQLAELRRDAAKVMIEEEDVGQLDRLGRAVREAEIQRQAVATRLKFALDTGKTLNVVSANGSQQVSGESELLVDDDISLVLPGLGTLTITPGGEDLAGLVQQHEDALQAFKRQLLILGVSDLLQAQHRLQSFKELTGKIQLAEQTLRILAPQGVDALRTQQELTMLQIRQLEQALARLPSASVQPVMALDEAQRELDSALALATVAQNALNTAEVQRATALSQRDQAIQERDAALAIKDAPQRITNLAQTRERWLSAQAEQGTLAARVAEEQAKWEAANPNLIDQDIQRLEQSLLSLQQDQIKRRDEMLVLQNTLELAGAQGLDEQRQQLENKLTFERKRLNELERRAKAIDLLCSKLEAKRQATLQRLQTPLLQRMRHYLELLFPSSTIEVDDNLVPQKLLRSRKGTAQIDTVDALSFGSREQLGLVSRFAYADLLAQAGRPTLLILDDALVHSDEERLSQMKRILFDVAQRHQVLVFTCHPNAWRDSGAFIKTI